MTDKPDTMPPLPEPDGFRTRYRSEPGMIGHYPWTYADQRRRREDRPEYESEDLFVSAKVHAYARQHAAAECAALVEALRHVAAIAHCGGLSGLSEADALVAVRRLTLEWFDRCETTEQQSAAVRAALAAHKEKQ